MNSERIRQLEAVKLHMLTSAGGVFLSSILCGISFKWDPEMPAPACTNGVSISFHPKFWDRFSLDSRKFALKHELEHIARLYWLRRGSRDNRLWNAACDYVINQDLFSEGYKIPDFDVLHEPSYRGMSEEAIYDLLVKDPSLVPVSFTEDVEEASHQEQIEVLTMVIEANNIAKASGHQGLSSDQELLIQEYLSPKADWRTVLRNLHLELAGRARTFTRQGRRSQGGMITPYYKTDKNRLAHLAYFIDMSLSTTDENVQQFLSEIQHIWTEIAPLKMSIFCFDEQITSSYEVMQGDSLSGLVLVGRGGTDLECVRAKIEEIEPTAAIVLSDMECLPMDPLSVDCEVFWGVVRNPEVEVPFGKVISLD